MQRAPGQGLGEVREWKEGSPPGARELMKFGPGAPPAGKMAAGRPPRLASFLHNSYFSSSMLSAGMQNNPDVKPNTLGAFSILREADVNQQPPSKGVTIADNKHPEGKIQGALRKCEVTFR